MNIHISDANVNSQFSQKLNGHNIHSPSLPGLLWLQFLCMITGSIRLKTGAGKGMGTGLT